MMSPATLSAALTELSISSEEAAAWLSVSVRTVQRWLDGSVQVTGPAEQAILAWLRLDRLNLSWKPDGIPIWEDRWKSQIQLLLEHNKELRELIDRVEKRGGPSLVWQVDLQRKRASAGGVELSFHALANGSFSPSTYRRTDIDNDLRRDQRLIEDGIYAFAMAKARSGVDWRKKLSTDEEDAGRKFMAEYSDAFRELAK